MDFLTNVVYLSDQFDNLFYKHSRLKENGICYRKWINNDGALFLDSSKAVISDKQQGLSDPVLKPVQKPSNPPLINTGQRRAVLLPPSSFTLPTRAKGASLHNPLPEGVEVRASTSTHPASTPRTSLDSEKRTESSPSSATSSPSRDSEDEKDGEEQSTGEYSKEEEIDEEREDEERKPDAREDAVKSVLLSQLKEEGNIQERVAAMKDILQEFQDMKVTYR